MSRLLNLAPLAVSLAALAVAWSATRAAPTADARAEQRLVEIERRLADIEAISPGGAATPGRAAEIQAQAPAIDDAHLKVIVTAELQAQAERMRAQWGGGQGGPGGGRGGAQPLADAATVKAQLAVDDAKAEQTAKIVADLRTATRDLWRQGGDREANTKKMQELRADAETKLAAVLDADELAKAKELLDQPGRRARGGPDGNAPADGQQPAQPRGTSF